MSHLSSVSTARGWLRRLSGGVAILLLASLILSACAPVPAAPAAEEPPAAEAPAAAPTAQVQELGTGSIELNMWDGIGASDGEILTQLLNKCVCRKPRHQGQTPDHGLGRLL